MQLSVVKTQLGKIAISFLSLCTGAATNTAKIVLGVFSTFIKIMTATGGVYKIILDVVLDFLLPNAYEVAFDIADAAEQYGGILIKPKMTWSGLNLTVSGN